MIILLHIIIAFLGIAQTTHAYSSPTSTRINRAFILLMLTIGSGGFLVIFMQAPLIHACVSGITYTTLVFTGIAAAQKKLATERTKL